jgi:hypothetical protein
LFSKKHEDLDLLIRFQKKTIGLIDVKTKLIKKRLKNEGVNVETIFEIFDVK